MVAGGERQHRQSYWDFLLAPLIAQPGTRDGNHPALLLLPLLKLSAQRLQLETVRSTLVRRKRSGEKIKNSNNMTFQCQEDESVDEKEALQDFLGEQINPNRLIKLFMRTHTHRPRVVDADGGRDEEHANKHGVVGD